LQQQPPLSSRLPCATGLCKTGRGQGHRAFGSDRRYRCGSRFRNIIRWCSPTSYHSESGRSLSHHRITDFDLPGDAPLYWFCLLSVIAESQLQVLNRVENCHSFKTVGREEARGVLRDGLSKIEHTARLRAATLASAASRCLRTAGNGAWRSGGVMLSPRFLRMQAEKCLRSALATTDLGSAADLRKMARDLESWANEAEFEIQRVRRRPLLEPSMGLH